MADSRELPSTKPKKVLLVDFDGVLFSEEREIANQSQQELNAWYADACIDAKEETLAKLKLEFNRKMISIGSIRSPKLLQMIFQEFENAGVHCIIASQRVRPSYEFAANLESELTKAGLKEFLHWEDAQYMVKNIKPEEAKGHDKLMMANAVMNDMKLVNNKKDIYLVDDSEHVYGAGRPYSEAGYKFHHLNVAEKGGAEYFEALQAWPCLMEELGVPPEKTKNVEMMIDVYRVNSALKACLQKKPPNLIIAHSILAHNEKLLEQVKKDIATPQASFQKYGDCYHDIQVLHPLSTRIKYIVNFTPPRPPEPRGFWETFFALFLSKKTLMDAARIKMDAAKIKHDKEMKNPSSEVCQAITKLLKKADKVENGQHPPYSTHASFMMHPSLSILNKTTDKEEQPDVEMVSVSGAAPSSPPKDKKKEEDAFSSIKPPL